MQNSAENLADFGTGPFLFEIDNPLMFGEVFHITPQQGAAGQNFPMRVTVRQKNYDASNPNWYAITFSEEYTGVPMGDFYDIDYRDSITSKDQVIVYYFNAAMVHGHMKHVNIEALTSGPESAYTVKFEFDQPVKVSRELD